MINLEVGKTYEFRDKDLAFDFLGLEHIKITSYKRDRYFQYQTDIPYMSFTENGNSKMGGEEFGLDLIKEIQQ